MKKWCIFDNKYWTHFKKPLLIALFCIIFSLIIPIASATCCLATSPNGKYVAEGCAYGDIGLYDQQGNMIWKKTFGGSTIESISFSTDGNNIDASNMFHQGFYMDLDGNIVARPVTPPAPTISLTIPLTTVPTTTQPTSTHTLPPASSGNSNSLIPLVITILFIVGLGCAFFLSFIRPWGDRHIEPEEENMTNQQSTVICHNCGKQLHEGAIKCIHCGNYLNDDEIIPEKIDNNGKAIGIVCGLFVLIFIGIVAIGNSETVAKSSSGLLYWIIFIILLIGILYEGWKAVTQ